MKQNMRNGSSGANNVLSRLGADKKKTVTALCLVAVMVFMWARMLGKKTPQSAQATPASIQTNLNGESAPESNITFNATVIGDNVSEVYIMVKECKDDFCFINRHNESMEKIDQNGYQAIVQLIYSLLSVYFDLY